MLQILKQKIESHYNFISSVFSIPRPEFMNISAMVVEKQFVCEHNYIYVLSHLKTIIKGLNRNKPTKVLSKNLDLINSFYLISACSMVHMKINTLNVISDSYLSSIGTYYLYLQMRR